MAAARRCVACALWWRREVRRKRCYSQTSFAKVRRYYRERGPRSGPREPLTSAREGRQEVFSFRECKKIWPELVLPHQACNHASFAREPTHP